MSLWRVWLRFGFCCYVLFSAVVSGAFRAVAEELSVISSKMEEEHPRLANSLPAQELFSPILADLREPQFSIRRASYQMDERNFSAGAVSFGDFLPLYDFEVESGNKLQFGIDGGVFSLFDLDTESYDLRNSDYIIGLSLAQRIDSFSYRLRLSHISSHLGDEYVLNNEEVSRDNPSYEDLEFLVAKEFGGLRLYSGLGGIVRTTDPIERLHFQGGSEFSYPLVGSRLSLLAAADLQTWQFQSWGLNQSYFLGFLLTGEKKRNVRLGAEFYRGFSPEGQFADEKVHYWGVAFYFSP